MVTKNITKTSEDINSEFQKRFRLIKDAVKSITKDDVDRAINLAVDVFAMLVSRGSQTSLLEQNFPSKNNFSFICTSTGYREKNLLDSICLLEMHIKSDSGNVSYNYDALGNALKKPISLNNWLDEIVIASVSRKIKYSRLDILSIYRDKIGAHADNNVNSIVSDILLKSNLGFILTWNGTNINARNVTEMTLKQIGYETLISIISLYGRNEKCPCGSNIKIKHCCNEAELER